MGTNCAPLVAYLFLFCYERDFMMSLSNDKQAVVIDALNTTSRYLDEILNIGNVYFDNMLSQIYPSEFQLNKANTSDTKAALLNRFKPSSKIFYWPFQGGTSFVDLFCFCSVLCLLCFVRVCLYVLCGHLLGKRWPLGSRLCCLLWVCHFPNGILGQVWYLIVSLPDLCNLSYFASVYFNGVFFYQNLW